MTYSFIDATSATSTTGGVLTMTAPEDSQEFDLMVMAFIYDGPNQTVTVPSGWTQFTQGSVASLRSICPVDLLCGASEPSTYQFSVPANPPGTYGVMARYRFISTSLENISYPTGISGLSDAGGGAMSEGYAALDVMAAYTLRPSTTPDLVVPATATERENLTGTNWNMKLADEVVTAATVPALAYSTTTGVWSVSARFLYQRGAEVTYVDDVGHWAIVN